MKNWKTTVGGILAAIGSYLVNSQTGVVNVIGQIAQGHQSLVFDPVREIRRAHPGDKRNRIVPELVKMRESGICNRTGIAEFI